MYLQLEMAWPKSYQLLHVILRQPLLPFLQRAPCMNDDGMKKGLELRFVVK